MEMDELKLKNIVTYGLDSFISLSQENRAD